MRCPDVGAACVSGCTMTALNCDAIAATCGSGGVAVLTGALPRTAVSTSPTASTI